MVGNAKKSDAPEIEILAQDWGKAFLQCGKNGMRGFQEKHLTPYAHHLTTHCAAEVNIHGGLKRFNGEALERLNDDFKKCHLRRTNCKDICTSLRIHKRWELARRNQAKRTKEKNAQRRVTLSCQVLNETTKLSKEQLRGFFCVYKLVILKKLIVDKPV